MKYRAVTGDHEVDDYLEACAAFIGEHRLDLEATQPAVRFRNYYTTAWAAGNLYDYALGGGESEWRDYAVSLAERVKEWIEGDPGMALNSFTWALSGGVACWGVVHVWLREHPEAAPEWLATYLPQMTDYVPADHPASYSGGLDWQNAWNSWYALAATAAYEAEAGFAFRRHALELARSLRRQDYDADGGIPACELDADDQDQTWVSTYITYMGFAGLDDPPRLELLMNQLYFRAGDRVLTDLRLTQPGLDDQGDLYLVLEALGGYYFYPTWGSEVIPLSLYLPIECELLIRVLEVERLPPGLPESTLTWWLLFTAYRAPEEIIVGPLRIDWRIGS